MFGPVSLGNNYPKRAKGLLIYFYKHYFPDTDQLGHSFTPYQLDSECLAEMQTLFAGNEL